MKRVILLLLILIFSSITTIAYAEDVLIIHQGYANSHLKWKNRLEDAGHTVTSVQVGSNGSSFPSNTTSYEQIYDLINLPYHLVQDYSGGPAIETAYKALLARGGTLYLQMENPGCCVSRNTNIMDFIEDVGGGSLSYSSSYSSNSITQHNSNESWLSGFSGTVTFSLAGILTGIGNGTWFAKDGNGKIVGAISRVPKKGSFLSNMSKGAKPINTKMTIVEKRISKLVADDLKKENIFFAGIDFIDQKLNGDINVTSPTGLKTYYDLTNINLAKTFWKELKA